MDQRTILLDKIIDELEKKFKTKEEINNYIENNIEFQPILESLLIRIILRKIN